MIIVYIEPILSDHVTCNNTKFVTMNVCHTFPCFCDTWFTHMMMIIVTYLIYQIFCTTVAGTRVVVEDDRSRMGTRMTWRTYDWRWEVWPVLAGGSRDTSLTHERWGCCPSGGCGTGPWWRMCCVLDTQIPECWSEDSNTRLVRDRRQHQSIKIVECN